jgi:glycosyltransferase involved in cell wall biosynthesis
MRILIFATDIIPFHGLPTSGTALRTFGLGKGLEAHGHEIIFAVPKLALEGLISSAKFESLPKETQNQILSLDTFDHTCADDLVSKYSPDLILCGHWPAMMLSIKPNVPVVIDLAGPHILERHYQQEKDQAEAIAGKLNALSKADLFIVSGDSQRYYFLSFLLRAGIKNLEDRIITIHMPLEPIENNQIKKKVISTEYPKFIFGGVFLPWQDPSIALRTLAEEINLRKQGSLHIVGGSHPNYNINDSTLNNLVEELTRFPAIKRSTMLPFEEFQDVLENSDIACDLMSWNLERQLAITIRTTTYLWKGLPVIYNDYADLAKLIKEYNAGWCVGNKEEFLATINQIYSSPSVVEEKAAGARKLAAEIFSWDRAVLPLIKVISGETIPLSEEIDIELDYPQYSNLLVTSDHSLAQHFTCRGRGLFRIEFRVSTQGKALRSPLLLSLFHQTSKGSDKQSPIFSKEIHPKDIANNSWLRFELPRQADSAGKEYILQISSNESSPEHAISPWGCLTNEFPMGPLFHGKNKLRMTSLCLKTTYRNE